MEKVKAGDADLLPAVNQLTDNALADHPTIASAVAWWEANKEKWTLPSPSQPSTQPARQDFDQMLEEGKAAWARQDYGIAEQLAQDVLKHQQATEEQKRRAQLILDRVAESRSGAGTSQPAAPPASQPSSAPTGQRP
jgi:cation diffusion facilitator CzcD-associated flavoprotein CzcO